MPFPSGGCKTCKKRRIKCDEAMPACQRCVKSHRFCSWVGVGVMYRPENHYASGLIKRPRGPRVEDARTCISDAFAQSLPTKLKTTAICHFFKNHVRAPDEAPAIVRGLTDDLLDAWRSVSKRPPILGLAVAAMALAVFSKTNKCASSAMEASVEYLQLLRIAQCSIPTMDSADIDAYLLAIFLMGRYENMVYQIEEDLHLSLPCGSALRSFSHHDGALAILKLWKDQRSQTQPATDVIKHTRRCMIKSSLLRTLAIPDWMMDGALFGECGWELDYDRLVVQIASLRQQWSSLLRQNTDEVHINSKIATKVSALDEEVRKLDEALRTWGASSPTDGSFSKRTIDDHQTRDISPATLCIYPSVGNASIQLLYRSTRLFVKSTRLKILEFGQLCPNQSERQKCLSQSYSIANDIASILPIVLQRIQTSGSQDPTCPDTLTVDTSNGVKPSLAELAVWPLTIAASTSELEEKQRFWFRAQLANIGRMIGDRVIEFDAADRWFRL